MAPRKLYVQGAGAQILQAALHESAVQGEGLG